MTPWHPFVIGAFGGNVTVIHVDFYVISIWLKQLHSSRHTVCMGTSLHMMHILCATVSLENTRKYNTIIRVLLLRASAAQRRQLSSIGIISVQMMIFKCNDAWFFTSKCCTPRSLNLQGQGKLQVAIYLPIGEPGNVGTNMRYKLKYKRRTGFSKKHLFTLVLSFDDGWNEILQSCIQWINPRDSVESKQDMRIP